MQQLQQFAANLSASAILSLGYFSFGLIPKALL